MLSVNWHLSGFVLDAMIHSLNSIASMVYQIVNTTSKAKYDTWKLPDLETRGFENVYSSLESLLGYLRLPQFGKDEDVVELMESLKAKSTAEGNESKHFLFHE